MKSCALNAKAFGRARRHPRAQRQLLIIDECIDSRATSSQQSAALS
jgi:hypothetical protein